MSSCGLKNSLCSGSNQNSSTTNTNQDNNGEDDGLPNIDESLPYRFLFVDAYNGEWTSIGLQEGTRQYHDIVDCPVGGMVVFQYLAGQHDVTMLADVAHYDTCNLTNSQQLSPYTLPNLGDLPDVSYYYPCTTPNETIYLTCSRPGHCQIGQRITIRTSENIYAYNASLANIGFGQDPWLLHSDSMVRILRLLGYHYNNDTQFYVMEHGYQTDGLANTTVEIISSGLDRCPDMAHDFDPAASEADCQAILYTLLGFVERKRHPTPNYTQSELYYQLALENSTAVAIPHRCAAMAYLSELYITIHNDTAAEQTLVTLCTECGTDTPHLIRQVQYTYNEQEEQQQNQQGTTTTTTNNETETNEIWPDVCTQALSTTTGGQPESTSHAFCFVSQTTHIWFSLLLTLWLIRRRW